MEYPINNPNQSFEKNNSRRVYLLVLIGSLVLIVVSFLFYFFQPLNSFWPFKKVTSRMTTSTKPFDFIRQDEELREAYNLYRRNKFQESYDLFSKILAKNDYKENKLLSETLYLHKIASLVAFDREAGYQEYYKFYKDSQNSFMNRAYALLRAQQEAIAYNEANKMLFFLNETEIKNMKNTSSEQIHYAINRKILRLYPFPITTARMASYEIDHLDAQNRKEMAKEIYDKYMFNFDENLKYMEKSEGLRHLVANSLSALGNLHAKMYELGHTHLENPSQIFEESLEKALMYSPAGTSQFLAVVALEYETKVKNTQRQDQLFQFLEETVSIKQMHSGLKKTLADSASLEKTFPNIFQAYKNDPEYKKKLDSLIK